LFRKSGLSDAMETESLGTVRDAMRVTVTRDEKPLGIPYLRRPTMQTVTIISV